ncbi:hypothetical protein C0416_01665 [bacterium]|nr:hypothetical protein [bacterium]
MIQNTEYPESFLRQIEVVGSSDISQEDSEKYWTEHKAGMTWGTQEALSNVWNPQDIAIFGAGKCNDIRLLEVMQRGSVKNIDLYDLDANGLEIAIGYVKSRINSIMPEAINFANFNPVVADVTFMLKNVFKKFNGIRSDFTSDFAPVGPGREQKLIEAILKAIFGALDGRQIPEKQYDVVVSDCILSQILAVFEIQIEKLRDDLLEKQEVSIGLWEDLERDVHGVITKDHFDVLSQMTKPNGAVFVASDSTLLYRGKVSKAHFELLQAMEEKGDLPQEERIRDFGGDYVVEELMIPRFKCMDGDIARMAEKHMPDFEIVESRKWEWNRDPHELQKDGCVFGAEEVQGVVLKRLLTKTRN